MDAFKTDPLWQTACKERKYQKITGYISGICFAIALIALVDGLIAQMRAGNSHFSLLPGESVILSGPTALKNPLASDLNASFTPQDAPLVFDLEGFFTGYWFGNGMWRGKVTAANEANPGPYKLYISFRGGAGQNAQSYLFTIYDSYQAMRDASRSFLTRFFNINPFLLASISAALAVLIGLVTYIFGRFYTLHLRQLGLAQILATNNRDIWCLVPKDMAPEQGAPRMIFNAQGHNIGEARANQWQKGKLHLTLLDSINLSNDCLIRLRPYQPPKKI